MANLSSFTITINLSGSVANPINSTSFVAVAPWGKSAVRSTLNEAINDVIYHAGGQYGGRMQQYFTAQTTNGTEVSSP